MYNLQYDLTQHVHTKYCKSEATAKNYNNINRESIRESWTPLATFTIIMLVLTKR